MTKRNLINFFPYDFPFKIYPPFSGNTYAAQVLPLSAQMELQMAEKEGERQKKRIAADHKRRKQEEQKRSLTPEPIEGRRHMDVQTELYLEELTDAVEEATAETQTDPMLDRPPTPKFIPSKSGRDAECQIEEGDLFDFDYEVQPILEVMVGKTMEQAMLEVLKNRGLRFILKTIIFFLPHHPIPYTGLTRGGD